MFVYLLIAAELGVLYGVFWYLYVREPKTNQRISADLWGSYEGPSGQDGFDPTLPLVQPNEVFHDGLVAMKKSDQYVLDQVTNHYVRVETEQRFMQRMARTVDSALGQLNVRP